MIPETRRRIFEGAALVLYFIIDASEIWPNSHFFAIASAWVGTSLILFAELPIVWSFMSTTGLGILAIIVFVRVPPILPEETETHGLLEPADDPTPRTGCDPAASNNPQELPYYGFGPVGMVGTKRPKTPPPEDATIVALDSNGIVLTKNDKVPLIRMGKCTLLAMQKTPEGIMIDASVYASSGALIARIKDNNFEAIENADYHIERKGDLSTLEIMEGSAERLMVKYLNPRSVRVRGIFRCPTSVTKSVLIITDTSDMQYSKPGTLPFVFRNNCFQNLAQTIP